MPRTKNINIYYNYIHIKRDIYFFTSYVSVSVISLRVIFRFRLFLYELYFGYLRTLSKITKNVKSVNLKN